MKKGFTLIELLAVIVILAIIALIATPIILNIINDTKKESLKRSAELYIKGVQQAIAKENLKEEFNPATCTGTTTLTCTMQDGTTKTLKVEIEGKAPTSSTITFENGKVKKDSTTIVTFDNKTISYDENGKIQEVESTEPTTYKTYANGDAVYFNVTTGKQCEEANAVSTTGRKEGCMKFYAFNDEEGKNTLNLILDHNTTASVAWNSSASNALGPNQVLTQLKTDTDGWVGTITPENYTMNQTGQTSNANYTIKYKDEGYKARLIEANEIAQVTGKDKEGWDETTAPALNWYYLDSNSQTQTASSTVPSNYYWLFDYTRDCTSYGCKVADSSTWGYWTSSSTANYDGAWYVYYFGRVTSLGVSSSNVGVRPVITIEKSKLN